MRKLSLWWKIFHAQLLLLTHQSALKVSPKTEQSDLMKSEDTEPNAEEVEKIEDISEQNEVISSSDGTWKYQWDFPCLASNTKEESQMRKQTKQKRKPVMKKTQTQKKEQLKIFQSN